MSSDDEINGLPAKSYWWALHRPDTYALGAFTIAFVALFSAGAIAEFTQAIIFSSGGSSSERKSLLIDAGVRIAVAALALGAAALSIRSEDEDTTWSAPVARAALLVASLALVLGLGAMIAALVNSSPNALDFGGG